MRKISGTGSILLREVISDLDVTDSIRCFFAALFLARDEKVDLEQVDDDILITIISS